MPLRDEEQLLNNLQVEVGASETDTVISEEFVIHDPMSITIDVVGSSTTVSAGITIKLQVKSGSLDWIDSKTASVTADGRTTIKLLPQVAGDQQYLPLRKRGRVVISSGAGDAVDIDKVIVTKGIL